ncbi:NAD-dependent epimerase/dehydratase family protein [Butyrivibrio sp. MC2013]|uniref:NAD-dependent epimerase/dehydratase family protein n=1 Tax=Butyrivibrio sp. MC2013 TaxID=1280686 RepID=UPI0004225DAD|nr:NAD-dependent epimerase/dehydratase family protein [Butyrivibrio sp. MC2013]
MIKVLIIGGSGTISSGIVKHLSAIADYDVYVLNRGNRSDVIPSNVHILKADINDEAEANKALGNLYFDSVCDFICFTVRDAERHYKLFKGRTGQFMFTSSASAYHKPSRNYIITEGTSLANPYWEYSRNKKACEEFFMEKYCSEGFPVTIIRPSHTYDERSVPVGVHGNNGSYQVIKRIMEEKPVIIHGDGSSLWALTHNSDFAVGYTGLIANDHAIGEAFQITGDEILSWDQIHRTICDALNKPFIPFHVSSDFLAEAGQSEGYDLRGALTGDKAASVVFDNSKLKSLVPDMKTRVPFKVGVRRSLDYIMSHEECRREDSAFDAFCDKVIAAQQDALKSFR